MLRIVKDGNFVKSHRRPRVNILFSCETKKDDKIIHFNDISFSFIRLNYTFLLETLCISYPKLDVFFYFELTSDRDFLNIFGTGYGSSRGLLLIRQMSVHPKRSSRSIPFQLQNLIYLIHRKNSELSVLLQLFVSSFLATRNAKNNLKTFLFHHMIPLQPKSKASHPVLKMKLQQGTWQCSRGMRG